MTAPKTEIREKHKTPEASEFQKESREKGGLKNKLEAEASKVDSSPDKTPAEKIKSLDPEKKWEYQLDGLTALNKALVSILSKLAKNGTKIEAIGKTTDLKQAVNDSDISLSLDEATALENLDKIGSGSGSTARHIRESWPKTVEKAREASKGFGDKYMEHLRKNPSGTLALTIAGAAGIYLGFSALKGLWKKAFGGESADKTEDKSWFRKEIMIPLGIMIAGAFLGKDVMKKIMAEAGLDYFKVEAEVAAGKISEETQQKIEEGGPAVEAAVQKMREVVKLKEGDEKGDEINQVEAAKEAENASKELIKELGPYEAAQKIFVNLYFHGREYTKTDKDRFQRTIDHLSGVQFSRVKLVYEESKNEKLTARSRFPEIREDIGDRDLFLLIEGMVKMSAFTEASKKPEITVKKLFESAGENPYLDQLDGLSSGMHQALAIGSIQGAIDFLGSQGMEIAKEGRGMLKKLNEELGINLDELNEDEKKTYEAILGLLISKGKVDQDPQKAVDELVNVHPDLNKHPKAATLAKDFFESIKDRTPNVLEKIYANFEIKIDGHPNLLRKNIDFRTLSFASACEFVALEKVLDSENESMNQVLILNSILRAFNDNNDKTEYTVMLVTELGKDEFQIKLPAAKKLKEYFGVVAGKAIGFGTDWLMNKLRGVQGFGADHVTQYSAAELRERIEHSSFPLTFGQEAAGTGLEIGTDTLAAIITTIPGAADWLASCENGEDFLQLIRVNGGNVAVTEGRDGGPLILIELAGEVFVTRPAKILYASLLAGMEGNLGEVTKIVTVSSAPFVVYGGFKGFLKPVYVEGQKIQLALTSRTWNALKGSATGLAYPLKAPMMAAGFAKNTLQTVVTGAEGVKAMGRDASAGVERSLNWANDVIHLRSGQNVENLVITENLLDRHFKMIENLEPAQVHIYEGDNVVTRSLKKAFAKTVDTVKRLRNPMEAITYDFHFRMTARYAERLGKGLNDFFEFSKTHAFEFTSLDHEKIRRIQQMMERVREFAQYSRENLSLLNDILRIVETEKGENIYKAVLRRLEGCGLEIEEQEAFARRIKNNPKKVREIFEQLEAGLNRYAKFSEIPTAAPKTETKKPGKKPEGFDELDRSFGKVTDEIKRARGQLEGVEKQILDAQKQINKAKQAALKPGVTLDDINQLQAKIDDARQIIAEGNHARAQLIRTINALDEVAGAEAALKGVTDFTTPTASSLSINLQAKTEAAEEALEISSEAMRNFKTEPGKLAKGLKYAGRGLAIFGAGLSFYEAGKSGYEAFTTNVEGRAGIKGAEAGMWTINALADSAAVAVMFGAEGAAVSAGAALATPLIPITYAGSTAFETLNEDTKTDYEWAHENPYKLLHEFYTTAHSTSLGEAWVAGFKPGSLDTNIKERLDQKEKTMHKIYRGLVAMQKNPRLLEYIATEPPSEEKNKEVEKRIRENYTPYHEFYYEHARDDVSSYDEAQKMVLEAQMFDNIMEMRNEAKTKGKNFPLGGIELNSPDYDVPNGKGWSLDKAPYFTPFHVIEAFKSDAQRVFETDPVVSGNIERMDTAYLLRLYAQMDLNMTTYGRQLIDKPGLANSLHQNKVMIKNYLEIKRGINFEFAVRNAENSEPHMSLETLQTHLDSLGRLDNRAYLEFEKNNYDMSTPLYALYKLGEFFGYGGSPSEEKLKKFFNAETSAAHGLYWNGKNWVLGERGWEVDDDMGPVLTTALIKRVISRMREQPDNILEHRSDALFKDAYDFRKNVERMADILEAGLAEGNRRGYGMSVAEAKSGEASAPIGFKREKIEYQKDPEQVKKELAEKIDKLKNRAGWTQLTYEIKDENTILMSRTDGGAKTTLKRNGENWSVENYSLKKLDLTQSVALANLKNHAENYVQKNSLIGETAEPFYLSPDGGVKFAEKWGVDNDYLKGAGWFSFYGELDLDQNDIVQMLNQWHKSK